MTIRLVCGDGVARLPQDYFEKSFFNNPDIAAARSYTLECKARSAIVNALLDRIEGLSEGITITEDNVDELQSLCKELGFRGLDNELRAFRGETGSDSVDLKEFLQLKERVTRQDKRLSELERQLNEVLSWKRKAASETPESISRQFQSLEMKVEELARVSAEQNVESSQKMEQALKECAKQSDLRELARDVATLKENDRKTSAILTTKTHGADAQTPAPRGRREFVYDDSNKLHGIIAHLTHEFGGNVHEKGIVNVTSTGFPYSHCRPENAVELGTNSYYLSKDEQNSWLCYDFKERRVIPTSYSVMSSGGVAGSSHLKSWVIQVSNDAVLWREIDHRDNNNDLNGPCVTANFKTSEVPGEGFRFFRLKQTGKNHGGNYALVIPSLEIFGTLFEK